MGHPGNREESHRPPDADPERILGKRGRITMGVARNLRNSAKTRLNGAEWPQDQEARVDGDGQLRNILRKYREIPAIAGFAPFSTHGRD